MRLFKRKSREVQETVTTRRTWPVGTPYTSVGGHTVHPYSVSISVEDGKVSGYISQRMGGMLNLTGESLVEIRDIHSTMIEESQDAR